MQTINLTELFLKDIIYYNYLKQCVFDFDFLIDSIYYKVK